MRVLIESEEGNYKNEDAYQNMKGLELSEHYFNEIGLPMIEKQFPEYRERIAAGLVGEGSDCFGFDDGFSCDHDWGPAFCIWLEENDYKKTGEKMQASYLALQKEFKGYSPRKETRRSAVRHGAFEITSFYFQFTGLYYVPKTMREWLKIPEDNLASVTNGKIFFDSLGQFTSIRNALLSYYPEDIRLKKIASACMKTAQSGQYNYSRCLKRGELVAGNHAMTLFINEVISLVFLLEKKYKPFYKWMHRAMKDFSGLGQKLYPLLSQLVEEEARNTQLELIEEISSYIIMELRLQGLSSDPSDYLWNHGPQVQDKIQDPYIKSINILAD